MEKLVWNWQDLTKSLKISLKSMPKQGNNSIWVIPKKRLIRLATEVSDVIRLLKDKLEQQFKWKLLISIAWSRSVKERQLKHLKKSKLTKWRNNGNNTNKNFKKIHLLQPVMTKFLMDFYFCTHVRSSCHMKQKILSCLRNRLQMWE